MCGAGRVVAVAALVAFATGCGLFDPAIDEVAPTFTRDANKALNIFAERYSARAGEEPKQPNIAKDGTKDIDCAGAG